MRLKKNIYRKDRLGRLIQAAQNDNEITAIFLFGSLARNEKGDRSDIDICLVMASGSYAPLEISQKKLAYLKLFDMDIQIFQQLPLYIRARIIKEGKILLCKNEDELYKIAFRTVTEFNDFMHIYREYLEEAVNVR